SPGDAITVGVSTHTYDIAGNAVVALQVTDTTEFSNIPPYIVSLMLSSDNSMVEVLFSEPVYATASATTSLSIASFNLGIIGARTGMSTPTITSITSVSSKLYQLALSYTVTPSGLEQLTFNTEGASIYDVQGASLIGERRICELIDCSAISYSVQLNDQLGPTITANLLDDSNNFIDLAFSEGVYGQVSPSTAISSDSFVLTQLSGETVTATITDIGATNVVATALSPGATEARVYLSFSDNLVGGEIFSIDLANTATVVDQAGNAMTVSQTNNTFTLNQPVSGPPSPINSTIVLAPNNFIADSEKVTYITINAIDSLGQSFTQGGYDIKVQTSLEQEIDATDNGDGSYYIIYTPERLP
ncbi:MAG: hypothetical protein EBT72_08210, partial [Flavobacteriia bacterium]|nr:hypothetical protein [Flavobacteriia bacterium]